MEVLQNARPTEDVRALRDPQSSHLFELHETNWALNLVLSVHHQDHLFDVLPLNSLLAVEKMKRVVSARLKFEFQWRLNHLLFSDLVGDLLSRVELALLFCRKGISVLLVVVGLKID